MDVRNDTTASDSGFDKSVELFVTSDGELKMSRSNSLDLKILGCVTCKLEDLSGQVLKDSSTVNCRGSTDSAVGTNSSFQKSVNSSDWELKYLKKNVRGDEEKTMKK